MGESAKDAALGLTAQTEKDEIVAGEQGIDDLRDDRVFVSVDTWKEGLAFLDGAQQIAADLIFDRTRHAAWVKIRNTLQLADGARFQLTRRMC